jgi:hypothetical protein
MITDIRNVGGDQQLQILKIIQIITTLVAVSDCLTLITAGL